MFNKLMTKIYVKGTALAERAKAKLQEERGDTNIIAIIVILAIVLALAIIFRRSIMSLFNTIWTSITGKTEQAVNS